jgi:hypothetical protein
MMSREYIILRPQNKPGRYSNLGASAVLILLAVILKRLAAGQSTFQAKE